jgi:hypothetical protein
MNNKDITTMFCFVYDFIKELDATTSSPRICGCRSRGPKPRMQISEVVTLLLFYHVSNYDCFKHYYCEKVLREHQKDFNLVSYQQFVKLIPSAMPAVAVLLRSLLRSCRGKDFSARLADKGVQIITRLKKGMKNVLMDLDDKMLLLKRSLIETVIDKIKFLGKFEHSRHRSVSNAFLDMMASLINYQALELKPSIVSLLP